MPHSFFQALVESLLKEYPNILVLRVRMPICEDLTYARNFITKIIKYEKVRPTGTHLHHGYHVCQGALGQSVWDSSAKVG
jgi:hypothetical protein